MGQNALISGKVRWFTRPALIGGLAIVLASLLVWIPFFVRGISCGHDFDFHFESWYEIAQAWKHGQLYPHWAQSPNWGAGEPRFVFYPPLAWLFGAALGLCVGWSLAAPVMLWLLLAATGLAVRALARNWLGEATSSLAGCFAIFSGYTLFTAFERGAYSELACGALLPLLLLYALRTNNPEARSVAQKALDGSALPLAIVIALLWLTNVPAAIMACYLMAFLALLTAWLERSWWPLARALVAVPLGLLGAAVSILPAVFEQRWIQIAAATDTGMRIDDSWLFSRHPAANMAFHDAVLLLASWLVVAMVTATLAAFLVARRRRQLATLPRAPLALFISLPFLVLFLQFPLSSFFWALLPKFYLLQFPWRLLLVLEAPLAIFSAAALASKRLRAWLLSCFFAAAALLLITATSGLFFYQNCDVDDSATAQVAGIQSGAGVQGTDEYAAPDTDNGLVPSGLPDACLLEDAQATLAENNGDTTPAWDPAEERCDAVYRARHWQPDSKSLTAVTDEDGFLVLRLRQYPAWKITVNGVVQKNLPHRQDGLITIPVSEGTNQVEIRWTTTPDIWLARALSLLSLPFFLSLGLQERRLKARQAAAQVS